MFLVQPRMPRMKTASASLTLALLAGGTSRRMGQDKGLLRLPDGTRLIQHIYRKLSVLHPHAHWLIITHPDHEATYQALFPHLTVMTDVHGPEQGPMAGLYTALHASQTDWIQLWPCDAPVICPALLQALNRYQAKDSEQAAQIPVTATDQRYQPLFGRYHRSLLPSLEAHLEQKRLALTRWLKTQPHHLLHWPDATCFTNLNTPEAFATFCQTDVT